MNNKPTGRLFLCIERSDEFLDNFHNSYDFLSTYKEFDFDDLGNNACDEDTLLIESKSRVALYVSANSFLLLDQDD